MIYRLAPISAVLLLAISLAPLAHAQELRVGAVHTAASHDLLGSPRGVSIEIGARLFNRLDLRIGVETAADRFESVGSICVGLAHPEDDCSDEVRRERAGLSALTLSLPIAALTARQLQLNFVPALSTAWVTSEQTGVRTERSRDASKALIGVGFGAEAIVPVARTPLALYVSGQLGALNPFVDGTVIDGYSPFEKSIAVRCVQLGLALRR